MRLDEFLKKIEKLKSDLSPHKDIIESEIKFYVDDGEDIWKTEIKSIEPDIIPGCLCWDGIDVVLWLKKYD